jgi:parvulin-like peptidyl-prolyl isomerase
MAAHTAEVDQEYEANRHRYTGLDKQVRSRHILIKAEESASDEEKAAARLRAEELLARVRRGEDFAALAREHSEDEGSARKDGDLGYNPQGRMVAPFDEAQFAMAVDQVSDVVETRFGFHIIKVIGIREGDVPVDEARLELAERLYLESRAEELAREAATNALAALTSGKTLDELDAELRGRDPAAPPPEEPSEDDTDALAPQVAETRLFGRADSPIPGVSSGALARAAFELTEESPLPSAPLQIGGDFFVFRLEERQHAAREDFTDGDRDRLRRGLLTMKQDQALKMFVHALLDEAQSDGAIRRNEEVLRDTTETPEAEG